MSLSTERSFFRLALVGALVASLGLASCGRKGPLDPPPGAALEGAPAEQPKQSLNPIAVQPMGGTAQGGSSNMLETPKGPKRSIPLDVLLN
ncbi:LPS translocon maturation chaperone LptM [Undibacter mobilis]|uniref:LPS translocon maturation chaperone LptM n=1 Tax=Undibacter mobilis TaxID=2292256 RepID=UPI00143CEB97|nr:lipoprotein [Undibacter mobilis]